MTDETKSLFTSKTFWGAVITALSGAFPHFSSLLGITDVNSVANNIVTGIGFLFTVYGRISATAPVTITGNSTKG